MSEIKPGLYTEARARQDMGVNPRLYQAMDLLYMPLLDLQARLEHELSENPFLELSEPDSEDDLQVDEEGQDDADEEVDWEQIMLDDLDAAGPRTPYEPKEYIEPIVVEARNLCDFLAEQLGLLHLDERQQRIAEEIIGNIDDDGLLSCSLEDVAGGIDGALERFRETAFAEAREIDDDTGREEELSELGRLFAPHDPAEIEPVLGVVQSFDPPGVGARDLRECLMIQLSRLGLEDTVAYRIVDRQFDGLVNHKWVEIARALEISRKEVQDAADEIAKLNPKPGSRYTEEPEQYVIPDLIVDLIGGEYMVFVNDTGLPRLRLSRSYREVVLNREKFVGHNKEFVTSKLNAAQWLIQVIEQRRQTMLRVMLVHRDHPVRILRKGGAASQAADVATGRRTHRNGRIDRLPGHERQVRADTRGGLSAQVLLFRRTSHGDGPGHLHARRPGQDQDPGGRRDPLRPLTDQAIVNLLKSEGIRIARRTVAKYRDQLGILPARMRKRV